MEKVRSSWRKMRHSSVSYSQSTQVIWSTRAMRALRRKGSQRAVRESDMSILKTNACLKWKQLRMYSRSVHRKIWTKKGNRCKPCLKTSNVPKAPCSPLPFLTCTETLPRHLEVRCVPLTQAASARQLQGISAARRRSRQREEASAMAFTRTCLRQRLDSTHLKYKQFSSKSAHTRHLHISKVSLRSDFF